MFKREHHIRIATVLQALDASVLDANKCFFGGGTAIALAYGEYRESFDLDFMVSDRAGYQALRQLITSNGGVQAIARPGMTLTQARDVMADRYGIRTLLKVADVEIKFEIVLEGRIEFETPGSKDRICGVSTLTSLDMAASKILANSDRWYDDGVFSRDLIDIAMMDLSRPALKASLAKATTAYGESAERDLTKAIDALAERKGRLEQCMNALKMDEVPPALLWDRIRKLNK